MPWSQVPWPEQSTPFAPTPQATVHVALPTLAWHCPQAVPVHQPCTALLKQLQTPVPAIPSLHVPCPLQA